MLKQLFFTLLLVMLVGCEDSSTNSSKESNNTHSKSNITRALTVLPQLDKSDLVAIKQICADNSKSNRILINFFASWCSGCVLEHKQLQQITKKVPSVGIAYKDDNNNALSWLDQYPIQFTKKATDINGIVGSSYGVVALPETLIISCDTYEKIYHKRGVILDSDINDILNYF